MKNIKRKEEKHIPRNETEQLIFDHIEETTQKDVLNIWAREEYPYWEDEKRIDPEYDYIVEVSKKHNGFYISGESYGINYNNGISEVNLISHWT